MHDQDDVQRLEHIDSLVGEHLHAPGVGGDRCQLVLVDPLGRAEAEPWCRTAGVVLPGAARAHLAHLSGPDEDVVTLADLDSLRLSGGLELVTPDHEPRFEGVDSPGAGHVEQHAASDQAFSRVAHVVLQRPGARHP